MSLATRCTECGTVFRVVHDQLKVSEGWVRCGRCSAVFNALENLCEIEADAPFRAAAGRGSPAAAAPAPASIAVAPTGSAAHDAGDASAWASTSAPSAFDSQSAPADEPPAAPGGDEPLPSVLLHRPSDARADDAPATPLDGIETRTEPAGADATPDAIVHFDSAARGLADAAPTPQFLKSAERAAYWRRPRVRVLVAVGVLGLASLLALQAAVTWRDLLAAHVPATEPALARWCAWTGCQITPLRRIDRLRVDSSGLTRLEGAALYRLTVVLRNRADTAVMAPALDLSLTDGQGRLVARKVLQGADLGLPAVLAAGQELPLQATIAAGERRISGYTVELFYP